MTFITSIDEEVVLDLFCCAILPHKISLWCVTSTTNFLGIMYKNLASTSKQPARILIHQQLPQAVTSELYKVKKIAKSHKHHISYLTQNTQKLSLKVSDFIVCSRDFSLTTQRILLICFLASQTKQQTSNPSSQTTRTRAQAPRAKHQNHGARCRTLGH